MLENLDLESLTPIQICQYISNKYIIECKFDIETDELFFWLNSGRIYFAVEDLYYFIFANSDICAEQNLTIYDLIDKYLFLILSEIVNNYMNPKAADNIIKH